MMYGWKGYKIIAIRRNTDAQSIRAGHDELMRHLEEENVSFVDYLSDSNLSVI